MSTRLILGALNSLTGGSYFISPTGPKGRFAIGFFKGTISISGHGAVTYGSLPNGRGRKVIDLGY